MKQKDFKTFLLASCQPLTDEKTGSVSKCNRSTTLRLGVHYSMEGITRNDVELAMWAFQTIIMYRYRYRYFSNIKFVTYILRNPAQKNSMLKMACCLKQISLSVLPIGDVNSGSGFFPFPDPGSRIQQQQKRGKKPKLNWVTFLYRKYHKTKHN